MVHQIQSYLMGVNLYLLYLMAVPALGAVVFTGGIKRSFEGSPALCWTLFAGWMLLATPFSTWPGGSFGLFLDYIRTDLPVLFVIAGLTLNWRDFKVLMTVIAAAAAINVLSSRIFQGTDSFGGRVGLQIGTVGNPNDYAAHLLLVLPFLLWFILTPRWFVLRILATLPFAYGLYLILATASRGAAIGLACAALLFFLWGTGRQRTAMILIGPIALAALAVAVPGDALKRIRSFSFSDAGESPESDASVSAEALESTAAREYLLKTSLLYMVENPLFGVGPGQFATFEGTHNKVIGDHGSWHGTHNTFTQAASECGIPAGLIFLAGIVTTFRLIRSVWSEARSRTDCDDIRIAAACLLVACSAFCIAITFVNFAYFFYLPAMAGFAIALSRCAREEFRIRSSALAR
jgi:O-antigen ligase